MSGGGGEKTEEPTEERKKKARKEGQIPRTPDLGAWSAMFLAAMLLPMVVSDVLKEAMALAVEGGAIFDQADPGQALILLQSGIWEAAKSIGPFCAALAAVGAVSSVVQGGLQPQPSLLAPKWQRVSPWAGVKRIFGMQAWWEAFKALIKTVVVGIVVYVAVRDLVPTMITSGSVPLGALLSTISGLALMVMQAAAGAGLALAILDYLVHRRRINKQIKMSKQEVKDEHKRSDGDPLLRGAIRAKQFAMSRQRMMSDVPTADVVLVNPTHLAVALRYDPAKGAPRVVAKGKGTVALKIREKATEHRIPLVQDAALARALYASCKVGQEIPAQLYEAVARVLAFIMMLRSRGSAAGTFTTVPSFSAPR